MTFPQSMRDNRHTICAFHMGSVVRDTSVQSKFRENSSREQKKSPKPQLTELINDLSWQNAQSVLEQDEDVVDPPVKAAARPAADNCCCDSCATRMSFL